jgi:hypothetical protein
LLAINIYDDYHENLLKMRDFLLDWGLVEIWGSLADCFVGFFGGLPQYWLSSFSGVFNIIPKFSTVPINPQK